MCLCARNQLGATPVLVSLERLVLSLPISIGTNTKLTYTAIQNRIVESNVKGGGRIGYFLFQFVLTNSTFFSVAGHSQNVIQLLMHLSLRSVGYEPLKQGL